MSGRSWAASDPEEWIVDGTLTGAQTVYERSAPRAAWLHVIRDADPDYPWRGVSPLQRASVSYPTGADGRRCARGGDAPADQGADPAPAGLGT